MHEVGKERLDGFFKRDAVGSEFVIFEVVIEIGRLEPVPTDHK